MRPWRNWIAHLIPIQKVGGSSPFGRAKLLVTGCDHSVFFYESEVHMDNLICVDLFDQPIGTATKTEAHQRGLLHRAFSVFIVHKGKMLIQKRAANKYHTAGLWSNACCSHPRYDEELESAVHRRLQEELGIDANCKELFSFVYRAAFNNGVTEYEFDHVFLADSDETIALNPEEAEAIDWISFDVLAKDLCEHPEKYTPWFISACPKVLAFMKEEQGDE